MARPPSSTKTSVAVPFVDLRPSLRELKDAILDDIAGLLDSAEFHYGSAVSEFETRFAAYCGTAHCVGTSNGLDGLRLTLLAAGIEEGAEVIIPANTFVATFAAIHQAGGIPVPVDASESDYEIDPALVESALTERTRFIVPVHLYGQMADMGAMAGLASKHGFDVIEDACQAHGAERNGYHAGSSGRAAAFSFYPSKNLGAAGDAGAVTTDEAELAARLRALRHHGEFEKYRHELEGYTARLDTIQAIVLLRKLPHLDRWTEQRRTAARFYFEALDGVGDLRLPPVPPGSDPVWHLYVVRTRDPEGLAAHLASRGIGSGRHYPQPPHLSAAFSWLGYERGDFPVAEALAREGLSLPLFPGITGEQLEAVHAAIVQHFG
ncbi:MAG TPA: DegT/DnrJ/EryC1/StrS family aminotransferase [Gaiellaceae bacterium]